MTQEIPRLSEPIDRDQAAQKRWEVFSLAYEYGLPAFRDVEPPGGYDLAEMPGQSGDLTEGVEINPQLNRTA